MKNTVVVQVVLFPDGPPRSIILSRLQVEDALARMNAPTFQAGDVIERYCGHRMVVLSGQDFAGAQALRAVSCFDGTIQAFDTSSPIVKLVYRAGKRVKG